MNLRLSIGLQQRLNDLAMRTGRPKAALIETLIDEAERERRYPGLRFRGPEWNRRACLAGTSLDVWQIVRALQDFANDADLMARKTDVSRPQLSLALAYYSEFPDEIDSAIALDRRPLTQLKRQYPFIELFGA